MSGINPTGNQIHGSALQYLRKEFEDETTCSVSIMVSYITNSGVNMLIRDLEVFSNRCPKKIRVIASTHGGITEPSALETLQGLGAEVRVSYDTGSTRFHGKAWIFEKSDKSHVVHVGSSNWTSAGLDTGEELNVLTTDPYATFLNYFDDTWGRLTSSSAYQDIPTHLRRAEMADLIVATQTQNVDLLKPFQRDLLTLIQESRIGQSSVPTKKDLLVAATGTGKTVISSVDFKELLEAGDVKSMLYIAHRREILEQALDTYRYVLGDPEFGELQPEAPGACNDAFVSVQWLDQVGNLGTLASGKYDYIVIDEAHHAAAASYKRLIDYFSPKYLLGLTATPERYDGKNILDLFGGKISAELRLWDAVSEGYLAKFKYYAVEDNTDLSNLELTRGEYLPKDLEKLYLQDNDWLPTVYDKFIEKTNGLAIRKVLGFCPSIEVSRRVAAHFTERGLVAHHVDGKMMKTDRDAIIKGFKNGSVDAIFSVDILNEGVDVPEANVVLLLRPTASSTVFVQQIGRGLRRKEGGGYCTIIDYVGNNNEKFDLESKFKTLIPAARARLAEQQDKDIFEANLDGCSIILTKDIAEKVLTSLRKRLTSETLGDDLAYLEDQGKTSLQELLQATGISLEDFYASANFTEVQMYANMRNGKVEPGKQPILSDEDNLIRKNLKILVASHRLGAPMFEPSYRYLKGKPLSVGEEGYVDALCRVLFAGERTSDDKRSTLTRRRNSLLHSALANEISVLVRLLAS